MYKKKYSYAIQALMLIAFYHVQNIGAEDCCLGGKSSCYLDTAMEMIEKAKKFSVCPKPSPPRPMDCSEVLKQGFNSSGVYKIWPRSRMAEGKALHVFCDMETDGGGWTVIQRRGNFERPVDYFYKDWASYKVGFGNAEQEFWLGNDNIFALSNQRLYSVRFDMKSMEGEKRYAVYDSFWIDDENNQYTIHIKDYRGDAGDSMTPTHDNRKFSTKDKQNDSSTKSCAELYKGGWWYDKCHSANLNGLNLRGPHKSFADGINWRAWKGYHESLDAAEIKIRPTTYKYTS